MNIIMSPLATVFLMLCGFDLMSALQNQFNRARNQYCATLLTRQDYPASQDRIYSRGGSRGSMDLLDYSS